MDSTSIRTSEARSLGKDDEQSSAKWSTNDEPESAEPETSTDMSLQSLLYFALVGNGRIAR
jgi:hypothetical protein